MARVDQMAAVTAAQAGDLYLTERNTAGTWTDYQATRGVLGIPVFANNIAAAGTNQSTATALTATRNVVTSAASGTGVVLPTTTQISDLTPGEIVVVANATTTAFTVYPPAGASIAGGSVNAGISLAANATARLMFVSATQYVYG